MRNILLLPVFLLCVANARSEPLSFQCPDRYPVNDVQIAEVPEGWEGHGMVSSGQPLVTAGAIDGSLAGVRAELHGNYKKTREGWESAFQFGESEKWIYCGYGSSIELLRRVAPAYSRCVITSKAGKDKDVVRITVKCS